MESSGSCEERSIEVRRRKATAYRVLEGKTHVFKLQTRTEHTREGFCLEGPSQYVWAQLSRDCWITIDDVLAAIRKYDAWKNVDVQEAKEACHDFILMLEREHLVDVRPIGSGNKTSPSEDRE